MKWLAKPVLWLMTSVIPVFIAACYGSPYDGDYEDAGHDSGRQQPSNTDLHTTDSNGSPSDQYPTGYHTDTGSIAFIKGTVSNNAGEGIAGIQVTCTDGADAGPVGTNAVYTMPGDGAFTLEIPPNGCQYLLFEDVDGPENGTYNTTQVNVSGKNDLTVILNETE